MSGLSFKKTGFSQDEKEKDNKGLKFCQKTDDSWKIFPNFTSKDFHKIKNNKILKSSSTLLKKKITKKRKLKKSNSNIEINHNKFINFRFNRAPTLKENRLEIDKILKKKKLRKMKELNNIYNNILINESKLFRNNLYFTSNELNPQKKDKPTINRSCDQISLNKYNFHKSGNEINYSSVENSSLFNKTGHNFNSSKNIFDNENKTLFNNNRSIIFQRMINSKDNDKKILLPSLSNITFKKNITMPINSISKMGIQVNDVIFNEIKAIKEFAEQEKRMMKFRIIQNIRNIRLTNLQNEKEYNIDHQLNILNAIKNKLDINYKKYYNKMELYIYFLKDRLDDMQAELKYIDKQIYNITTDIEKLIFKIVKKQTELEYLVEIRNFLLKVKDYTEKKERPVGYYYKLLIKDSKKLYIGDYFLNLKIVSQMTNKTVMDFINSILDLKEKIEDNKINIENLEYDYYIHYFKSDKVEPIFDSIDDFMKLYEILMDRNLNNLEELQYIKKITTKLKKEYNELCIIENNIILEEEIIEKKEIKDKLIKNNELLHKKYNYYIDYIQKNRKNIKINQKKKRKDMPMYLNINVDLDLIYREKYTEKLKSLKYNGILFLEKVISVVKNFLKLDYAKKDFYNNFMDPDRLSLLEINPKSFDDNNIKLIDEYILKIVSIYEDICKYVLSIHEKYMSDKKSLDFILMKKEELFNNKKIKTLHEQRKMKEIKINEENKRIMEKCYKPLILTRKGINDDITVKRNKILKIKCEKKHLDKEKIMAENEFNNLTKYNDDDNM